MIDEIFKDIKDFEGRYKISNFGRVIDSKGKDKTICIKDGSSVVYLSSKCISHTLTIPNAVLRYFLDKQVTRSESITHLDGNKQNNRFDNLQVERKTKQGVPKNENLLFKVYDDRNALVFVTPVRLNASRYIWDKLGYKPEPNIIGQLIGGTYRIEKFIPECKPFVKEVEDGPGTDPECIGYYYK